jgi:hypothetical protein
VGLGAVEVVEPFQETGRDRGGVDVEHADGAARRVGHGQRAAGHDGQAVRRHPLALVVEQDVAHDRGQPCRETLAGRDGPGSVADDR